MLELLLEPEVSLPLTAFVLCCCKLAIKLCMNCCIAAATSWLLVLELEELAFVDDVPEVALALLVPVVLSPVTPICERASNMELISPPPGGGGCDTSELTPDVLVVSD